VIEEAPAPGMDEATREQLCAAAVKAAKAVDYVGAGTIEFIADASDGLRADRIWFMEMNTRLQVEHPVTEEITGVDLVEWQLRVASGEALPKRQDELSINGWAMEARLYAEDPATGFLPSPGPIDHHITPAPHGIDVRIESGLNRTDVISPFYDPMIAKVVVHSADRSSAIADLERVCSGTEVAPAKTNAGFLTRVLRNRDFITGGVTTAFIDQNLVELTDIGPVTATLTRDAGTALLSQAVAPLNGKTYGSIASELESAASGEPWRQCLGFRLNRTAELSASFFVANERRIVAMEGDWTEDFVSTEPAPGGLYVFGDGECLMISQRYDAARGGVAGDGTILSPMPGRIIAVDVAAGDSVTKGQKLVTLEAMKMEHSLTAPFDGVVAELNAEAGAQVQVEALLVRIDPA
jgi:3-methylcrotonyl-CoA carboxylase alpha subunit